MAYKSRSAVRNVRVAMIHAGAVVEKNISIVICEKTVLPHNQRRPRRLLNQPLVGVPPNVAAEDGDKALIFSHYNAKIAKYYQRLFERTPADIFPTADSIR